MVIVDTSVWRRSAISGIPLPWNDALTATLTLGQDCRVYAVDRHFEAMAQHIGLQLYKPGYNGNFQPEA